MADNWYELDIHLSKTDKNNIKKYNIYSEENYNENLNKKFLALRYDGFGGRMMALLNAMYCSKKFHLPFVFNWSTKGVEYYKNIDGLGNKVLGIDVGKVEEIFSQDFIQQYFVPDEITWQFGYKDISFNGIKWKVINEGFDPYRKNKNFHFKDLLYYKSETPLGWIMPFDSLLNIFKDINKDEYKKIIKDCWNDIGFSKEFSEIIQKVDAAVQDKGKFITIHVRSGDIIYRSPWYIYKYKALVLELAVEIIVQELPNYNVVLLGDDITSLERTIEFSLQAIKERSIDCHGHSIIFAKDLIEDNIYIYIMVFSMHFMTVMFFQKGKKFLFHLIVRFLYFLLLFQMQTIFRLAMNIFLKKNSSIL